MKKTLGGFSLIEVLVVIFIISLVSGSILAGYLRSQGSYYALKAAQKLSVDLRRAQNMALSGTLQGAIVPAGYGIHIKSDNGYSLFYNVSQESIFYDDSVILDDLTLDNATLSPVGTSIFFQPPEPETCVNGSNTDSQTITITSNGSSKSLTIFAGGRIEIN